MTRDATTSLDPQGTAVRWLVELCRHDTTTGNEDRGLAALSAILEALGAKVERFEVAPGRSNVLATWGEPKVLFSTHTDTVPPFLAPALSATTVRGRGACDAKGQIVAQLGAIERLRAAGVDGLGWLGVVGEETDSVGASAAGRVLGERLPRCAAVVVGEPTGCRLATGQRGIRHYRLEVRGREAHSSLPELGRNAILELLDWIAALRSLPPGSHEELGQESWNLGTIDGGSRANVIPGRAAAELLLRSVPGTSFEAQMRRAAPPGGEVTLLQETPPDRFPAVPGFARAPVPFGSDAPRLRELATDGTVVLAGPGRIELAHSDHEEITLEELAEGVELNVRLARHFLGESA